MPFKEKSAWIMTLSLLMGGVVYFMTVMSMSSAMDRLAPPIIPVVAVYTIILVLISILGHTLIGLFSPKEANAPIDEREKMIFIRASSISSYAFGFGVITALGYYLISHDGDLLFYGVFASLMLGQLMEYVVRIALYRTSI